MAMYVYIYTYVYIACMCVCMCTHVKHIARGFNQTLLLQYSKSYVRSHVWPNSLNGLN